MRFRRGGVVVLVVLAGGALLVWVTLRSSGGEPSATNDRVSSQGVPVDSQHGVDLIIDTGAAVQSYQSVFSGTMTAAELLLAASQDHGFSVASKDYGGELGLFVEGIAGVQNDPTTDRYWSLYVNGEVSQSGASTTVVQPGDEVLWKYAVVDPEEAL